LIENNKIEIQKSAEDMIFIFPLSGLFSEKDLRLKKENMI